MPGAKRRVSVSQTQLRSTIWANRGAFSVEIVEGGGCGSRGRHPRWRFPDGGDDWRAMTADPMHDPAMTGLCTSLLGTLHSVLRTRVELGSKAFAFASNWSTSGAHRVARACAWPSAPFGSFSLAYGRAGRTCLSSSSQTPSSAGIGLTSAVSGVGSTSTLSGAR